MFASCKTRLQAVGLFIAAAIKISLSKTDANRARPMIDANSYILSYIYIKEMFQVKKNKKTFIGLPVHTYSNYCTSSTSDFYQYKNQAKFYPLSPEAMSNIVVDSEPVTARRFVLAALTCEIILCSQEPLRCRRSTLKRSM